MEKHKTKSSSPIKIRNDAQIQIKTQIDIKINTSKPDKYYRNKWKRIVETKIIPDIVLNRRRPSSIFSSHSNLRLDSLVSRYKSVQFPIRPSNIKLRPQVKQARAANKNCRCNGAAHLL